MGFNWLQFGLYLSLTIKVKRMKFAVMVIIVVHNLLVIHQKPHTAGERIRRGIAVKLTVLGKDNIQLNQTINNIKKTVHVH